MPKPLFHTIAENKQSTILSCALEEFSRHEFHDASINCIIRCAGIPRGSFYQYFTNKEDLYFYLFETIFIKQRQLLLEKKREELPKDPFLFHQTLFHLNLHLLENNMYQKFFQNFFLSMNYRLGLRYKAIVQQGRATALRNLPPMEKETACHMEEVLEILALITHELLALKVLENLSNEEIWRRYHAKLRLLGLSAKGIPR